MGDIIGDSQTEVIRKRFAVALTFGCNDVAPLVGAINAGSAIPVRGLVSRQLNSFRVQPSEAIDPQEGVYEILARGRHFGLWVFLAI